MFNNSRRAIAIFYILYKHGALFWLKHLPIPPFILSCLSAKAKDTSQDGERLSNAFEELGPLFIKLGQALSTRADFVGDEIAESLSRLQDKLPAFSGKLAIELLEASLQCKVTDLFVEFAEEAVAAASIAQVHRAVTIDQRQVAVKILRPEIAEIFAKDLALLRKIARFLEVISSEARRLKLIKVIDNFAETVKLELNLRFEAASCSELRSNCQNDPYLYIPEVDWTRTTESILTTEWIDGIPIDETVTLLAAGYDLDKLATNLAMTMFNQAYRDGFFHADMHPGNVLVNDKQQIALVDFGIMGYLDRKNRIYVAEIMRGFLHRDYKHVAKIHFTAGYVPANQSIQAFTLACRSIGEPIFGINANKASMGKLLAQLFKITQDFEMETQPQLLLLQKTMILVEGLGSKLNPNVNLWQLAEHSITEWGTQNLGFDSKIIGKIQDLVEFVGDTIPRILKSHLDKELGKEKNKK
jgi:ubiquinone biosynthesis protein